MDITAAENLGEPSEAKETGEVSQRTAHAIHDGNILESVVLEKESSLMALGTLS